MVETQTPRFALPQWSAGTDYYPGRVGFNTIMSLLENQAAVAYPSGPVSSMPRSGTFGRFFFATDMGQGGVLYYDGGGGWVPLNLIGGGGPGTPIAIGRTATVADEGNRAQAARADHVHTLPLATAANHGALASQHFALLDGAAVQSTAGTLALRDAGGRLNAATPTATTGTAVATLNYLNTRLGTSKNGTWDNVADTPVVRGSDGTFYVSAPTKGQNPATKAYTDSKVSRAGWKCNWREMPYGLPEVLSLDTGMFDYRADEDVPAEARGTRNVLGSTVENVAEVMPLLAVAGEDGEPERINDRDLIWPLIAAVQELSAEVDGLREQLAGVRHHLGLRG